MKFLLEVYSKEKHLFVKELKIYPMTQVKLVEAISKEDFQAAVELFRRYELEIDVDLCFQNFEEELKNIDKQYSRPDGILFLAKANNEKPIGCGGLRRWEDGICELKRMYLMEEGRGLGLGKTLLYKAIETAKDLGYSKMRLDTLPSMKVAIQLYEKNGFYEIDSYRHNPVEGVKYYERDLTDLGNS